MTIFAEFIFVAFQILIEICIRINAIAFIGNETTKFIHGKNCEYLSDIKKNDTKLSIIPFSPVISTKK